MSKPRDKSNSCYLTEGSVAAVKTKNNKKVNYGQTVKIKKIRGPIVTACIDTDTGEDQWIVLDAKDLHNNNMPY